MPVMSTSSRPWSTGGQHVGTRGLDMRAPRLRITIRGMMVAVAVVSVLLGGIILCFRPDPCRVTLVNRSGQPISELAVTVWGERMVIEDLRDGALVTLPFPGR